MNPNDLKKLKEQMDALSKQLDEKKGYSAKAAHAGKDIGKPGKNFDKIANKASKKYGSKEAGERVAGAVLSRLRNEGISMEIDEKLSPSMGIEAYIDDFVHSKDKRFAGKSKEERINMAKGAFYGAKNESAEPLEERNKENKFKKDLHVANLGREKEKLRGMSAILQSPKFKADRDGHDHRLASYPEDHNDEAGGIHSSRKEALRNYKTIGRKAISKNIDEESILEKYNPQADIDAGYQYYVIDKQTKGIVGRYKTGVSASNAVDKKDNAYGGYRYSRRRIDTMLNENEGEGATEDSVTLSVPLLIRCLEWARESAGEDIQLHKFVEAVENLGMQKELDSDDYENIISQVTPNDPGIDDNGPEDNQESD